MEIVQNCYSQKLLNRIEKKRGTMIPFETNQNKNGNFY